MENNKFIKKKPASQEELTNGGPAEDDNLSEADNWADNEVDNEADKKNEPVDADDRAIEVDADGQSIKLIDNGDDAHIDSEPADSEPADSEPADSEPADQEAIAPELIDTELAGQELIDHKCANREGINREGITHEGGNLECICNKQINHECMDGVLGGQDSSKNAEADAERRRDSEDKDRDFEDKDEDLSVVGIRFEPTGKTYDYFQNGVELRVGDWCIVEMEKGEEITRVFRLTSSDRKKQGGRKPLRKIIRKATHQDLDLARRNEELGKKAQVACQKKIMERGLPMKLIKVRYSFDGTKAVFYFTAEGRIDFRDLVKDLAVRFKTRIEMRQIGVRDEARMISGFGCCGRQLCCSLFLREFEPVSIRMAKDQCLTLNPGKISGICGRLMCCLVYEASVYEEVRKKLPKLGERVLVNNEEGKVVSFDILKSLVFVGFPDGRMLKVAGTAVQRIKGEQQPKKPPKKSQKQDGEKQGR